MAPDLGELPLTRSALHSLVWQRPMQALSAQYQISDVGLAKVCRRFDIPVPGLGHWRKKETGHPVRAVPLPAKSRFSPDMQVVTLRTRVPESDHERIRRQQLREVGTIAVPATLGQCEPLHPLVAAAKSLLEKHADPTTMPTLKPGQWYLDINVFPESLDRALRIIDTLVKAVEDRGYKVRCGLPRRASRSERAWQGVSQEPTFGRKTVVAVDDIDICIALRETRKTIPRDEANSRRGEHTSSGELTLTLTDHVRDWAPSKKWIDRRKTRIEDVLGELIVSLPVVSDEARATIRQWAKDEAERQRRAIWQQEQQLAIAARKRREEAYDAQLAGWLRANDLRALMTYARDNPTQAATAAKALDVTPEEWFARLEAYILSLDPFMELR